MKSVVLLSLSLSLCLYLGILCIYDPISRVKKLIISFQFQIVISICNQKPEMHESTSFLKPIKEHRELDFQNPNYF
jgi:hypothetical protein